MRSYAREKEPTALRLLKFTEGGAYPIAAPVLYPNLKGDQKLIFRTEIIPKVQLCLPNHNAFSQTLLLKIIRVMLFGEGSLSPGPVVNKCVGKIWNVKKISDSLVSLAGITVSLWLAR
jgi:hypothetical protein